MGEHFPSSVSTDTGGLSFLEFFQSDRETGRANSIVTMDLGEPRMIKNERQYRITKKQAACFSQTLEHLRQQPAEAEDVHPLIAKAQEDALRSQLADLEEQLREYESLKAGSLEPGQTQSRAGRANRAGGRALSVTGKSAPGPGSSSPHCPKTDFAFALSLELDALNAVAELPSILIKARIAQGLRQKDLAERLGLNEHQIQRYEATDYATASLARIKEVANALGLESNIPAQIPPTHSHSKK